MLWQLPACGMVERVIKKVIEMTAEIKTVCVIGLGYVGLPLAVRLAEKGYHVFGYDVNLNRVVLTNRKISHIKDDVLEKKLAEVDITATIDPEVLKEVEMRHGLESIRLRTKRVH